jgi:hypothetical protein
VSADSLVISDDGKITKIFCSTLFEMEMKNFPESKYFGNVKYFTQQLPVSESLEAQKPHSQQKLLFDKTTIWSSKGSAMVPVYAQIGLKMSCAIISNTLELGKYSTLNFEAS